MIACQTLFLVIFVCFGGNPTNNVALPLWPAGQVPGAKGTEKKDIPTLTPYLPDPSRFPYPCPAFVISPGGGYDLVSYVHEGKNFAIFLNEYGIAGFVLTYRTAGDGYRYPSQYDDVERAIRTVRSNAKSGNWDIKPDHIGVLGASAGGHLSAMALTRFDEGKASTDPIENVSSRPDLGVLVYALITLTEDTHVQQNLLGSNVTAEMIHLLSNENYVTDKTAPTFLFHNKDDNTVPYKNSVMFSDALEKVGVLHELDLYPSGGHGIGIGLGYNQEYDPSKTSMDKLSPYTADLAKFLIARGWTS